MSQIISKKLAIDVMNAALSTGADYAEIYAESSRPSSISIDNGKVDSISTPISEGAGIRLLKGVKSAYGYTSDLSRKNLLALAGKVAKSFEGERLFEVKEIKKERVKAISPIETHLNDVSAEEKIAYLKKAHEAASSVDPRIVRVTASFISKYKTTQTFVAENEIGHQYDNVEERGRVGIVCIAAWTIVCMIALFQLLKHTCGIRASKIEEIEGLDKHEHGLPSAYADFTPVPLAAEIIEAEGVPVAEAAGVAVTDMTAPAMPAVAESAESVKMSKVVMPALSAGVMGEVLPSEKTRMIVQFCSLVLWRTMEKRIQESGERMTVRSALQSLDMIMSIGDGTKWQTTEVSPYSKHVLDILHISLPRGSMPASPGNRRPARSEEDAPAHSDGDFPQNR